MGIFSYSKADRIRKRPDFTRLIKTGKRLEDEYFIVKYSEGNTDRTRIGITVTKKVGNAIKRNRIKRLCRESFRLKRNHIRGNWDINIIAKIKSRNITSKETFRSLEGIFRRIN